MTAGSYSLGKINGCKTCGTLLSRPAHGRPKVTCGGECARIWANTKRRASRARRAVLDSLETALRASSEVEPIWNRVNKLRRWLERQDPAELCEVLERDLDYPASASVTWPKSAL